MPQPGTLQSAVLEITNQCNLRCPHCASSSGLPREDELSLSEWQQVLTDIRALGGEEITLIGGELFLRSDWFDIAAMVGNLGMRLILISNGLLIDNEKTLAKLRQLHPYLIGISIDGATTESYQRWRGVDGFTRVLGLLSRLRADGHPQVNAITTFTRGNLREFDDFSELFDGSGITWQVQLANHAGERFDSQLFITREDFRWLADKMRAVIVNRPGLHLRPMDDFGYFPLDPALRFLHQTWAGCIAGLSLIGVRSNGDVLGCLSLGDDFVEANLRHIPLPQLWWSQEHFRQFRDKEKFLGGACAKCSYGEVCRAGCAGIAYSATGSIGNNPYCIRALETEDILAEIAG